MIERILLDIDGVLVNFVAGACRLFGKTEEEIMPFWKKGEESMCKALGHDQEELWQKIEAAGPKFWIELPVFPWAKEIYRICQEHAPTAFLTFPTPDPGCIIGKYEWIKMFTGEKRPRGFLIGDAKDFCACPTNLLIDDQMKNIRSFSAANGITLFFPRPPNDIPEDYCAYVKKFLDLRTNVKNKTRSL